VILAGIVVVGVIAWKTHALELDPVRHAGGTTGGGDAYTHAEDAAACIEQMQAFTDYPLLFAGSSVLGYPLTGCQHMRTETLYGCPGAAAPSRSRCVPWPDDGSPHIAHPGGDAWSIGYGTCTIPEGRESCGIPISIRIDPCARVVDGRVIERAYTVVRGTAVRGVQPLIGTDGGLEFELPPYGSLSISAPQGGSADERATNAVTIAGALIPANVAASPLSPGAPLTATLSAITVACP